VLRSTVLLLVVSLLILAMGRVSYAQAKTTTGFYYPTGTSNPPLTGGKWLATGCSGDTYIAGMYHLGYDLMLPRTQAVRAISRGVVKKIMPPPPQSGTIDPDLSFVWIEHKVKDSPTGTPYSVVVVYGHIRAKSGLTEGATVQPFDEVGYILPYPASQDHLHFGVNVDTWFINVLTLDVPYYFDSSNNTRTARASIGWGRGNFGNFPSGWCSQRERNKPLLKTRGFVDPLGFIESKYPSEDTPPGNANTIYVGVDGDDSRDGRTWDRRVKTLTKAVSLVNAGGTIRAGGGHYSQEAWPLIISKNVKIVCDNGGVVHVGR
jgi:hypothetical protein